MIQLENRYGTKGFYFLDDNFLSNYQWTKKFCSLLAQLSPNIRWGCDLRASEITRDRLAMLWKGGCRALYVGLETFSDNIRTSTLGKSIGGKAAFDKVDLALGHGFCVRASIGIGWPRETAFEMEETFEAVRARDSLF